MVWLTTPFKLKIKSLLLYFKHAIKGMQVIFFVVVVFFIAFPTLDDIDYSKAANIQEFVDKLLFGWTEIK